METLRNLSMPKFFTCLIFVMMFYLPGLSNAEDCKNALKTLNFTLEDPKFESLKSNAGNAVSALSGENWGGATTLVKDMNADFWKAGKDNDWIKGAWSKFGGCVLQCAKDKDHNCKSSGKRIDENGNLV